MNTYKFPKNIKMIQGNYVKLWDIPENLSDSESNQTQFTRAQQKELESKHYELFVN